MPHQLPLPLTGIRVLDATHIVAGPFCSQILADMGAEVIKIERPRTGDLVRGRGPYVTKEDGQRISSRYIGLNRNKKSVTLDLRNPRCKAAFEEMVKVSDVLLDNWGPGAFRRLGLGYEHLKELNPGLIYASITGYGDSDDLRGPYSNWPANNLAIQGMAGWMELTGEPGRPPQSVGDNIGDSIPGVWSALGVVLALRSREQTGQGQHVDMAMYECMVLHTLSNMYGYEASGELFTRDYSRLANAGHHLPGQRRLRDYGGGPGTGALAEPVEAGGAGRPGRKPRVSGPGRRRLYPRARYSRAGGLVAAPAQVGGSRQDYGTWLLHGGGAEHGGLG